MSLNNPLQAPLDTLVAALKETYGPKVGFLLVFSDGDPREPLRLSNTCVKCQRLMLEHALKGIPEDTEHTHS